MNIESLREYCLSKNEVEECLPFGPETLVFKVGGKIFALTNLEGDWTVNLKCDPERALSLREEYPCIIPGWHMNKVHWNTILLDGSISDSFLMELIDHSYSLVYSSISKKKKSGK